MSPSPRSPSRSRRRVTARWWASTGAWRSSAALSTGELLHCPGLTARERIRLRRLQRKLARAKRGSNRRGRVKHAIARLRARETDRRKDWAEKASTGIARRFDVIRVEDLQISEHDPVRERHAGEPGPERPARRPG